MQPTGAFLWLMQEVMWSLKPWPGHIGTTSVCIFDNFSSMESGFLFCLLRFKFQNVAFPIPALSFLLLAFPRHSLLRLALSPGFRPALSSLSDRCVFLLRHVEPFPLTIHFYNMVLVGKPPLVPSPGKGPFTERGMCS